MRKVVTPGGATKPAATFKVGDKVVLYPTAVMSITAIGPRRELQPPGATFEPLRGLDDKSVMQPTTSDEAVYALCAIGEERDSFLLEVKATTRPPLRKLSTAAEVDTFLAILGETLQDARVKPPPAELAKELTHAGNDLVKLARVFPYLRTSDAFEHKARTTLDKFFVQEVALVRGLDERDARALLDRL